MKCTVNLDFWFDSIDMCTEQEIKEYLLNALLYGAESTNSDIDQVNITIEEED